MKTTTLWIETNTNPRTALRKAAGTGSYQPVVQLAPFVGGDTLNYNLVLLSDGAIDSTISGVVSQSIKLGVGVAGSTTYATSSRWYVSSSWGYTGSLNTHTLPLSSSLVSASLLGYDAISAVLELEITDLPSNTRKTYLQAPVQIYTEVLAQSGSAAAI